jgi:bifunctional enzyme CysN/CysC
MAHMSDLIATDIDAYLQRHQHKSLLRFITCGSVDDGKSTLLGRLLYDSKLIFDDHLKALESDSKKFGTQGDGLDLALLVDGLAAEREQGITIDVAYRFFSTENRKFIVADTPGHEQYTRNMVTGASTADLAVVLVDARKGILTQTRRHSFLAKLVGVRHIVLAVNKMDLVQFSKFRFDAIVESYRSFLLSIDLEDFVAIPISGLMGDNITTNSLAMSWYHGPALLPFLERVEIDTDRLAKGPFRMPVQWVNRPNQDFRGFAGQISNGVIRVGDAIRVAPSGTLSHIAAIVTSDGNLDAAVAGQSVTLTLADEIDCSRGDILSDADDPIEVADQFRTTIVWMHEEPLLCGRPYWLKLGTRTVSAQVTEIRHRIDVNTLEKLAATDLKQNEIAVCNISLDRPIGFEAYDKSPDLGGFILIDRTSNATLAAGMIRYALRRAHNIHWQSLDVTKATRAAAKGQRPVILWFTGLSGAGKSTIANLVEKRLQTLGLHTYLLDGDNVRHGLNRDLGFTDADRVENIRRVAEVAKLMLDAGLIVLVSFISPFRAERLMARDRVEPGEFVEIFVDTPLSVAEGRDRKGLYREARAGRLKNFTGIDSPYEIPEQPDIRIDTTSQTPEQAVEQITQYLGYVKGM